MTPSDAQKLIVACLSRGKAHEVAEALHADHGIDTFQFSHGRGAGLLRAVRARDMIEVDMLVVMVPHERADEIFAVIHELAEIDRPGGGLMLQMPAARAATLGLPLPLEQTVQEA
ncbi:MAG: hypothetical protein P8Q36_18490 [Alphaproteobacteria bacterium]|jgi:hypothetical protein|nr:hypothetical protein [Rhodospirillaceae bacterium]MDG2482828.1 hypothetical protein [Alphaproteobacteria bacterium]MBT6205284.1 hypothetical protein [Rhodospirillaceae bacterium]MBT6513030.1 hypothetical protein [Rhodospirillaceae bacterium]MBT7611768.1 hypothetical protein [Rhodospirillaceae bacterium]